jgi:LysR family transcriptional regulator, hydrogen peroxide-inducible genes activator
MALSDLSQLRLQDLEVFLEVIRARSVREAARRLKLTPGQVSKSVQSLEKKLGHKLFQRSRSGVMLTSLGNELMTIAREIMNSSGKIENLLSGKKKTKLQSYLTMASTSFLNVHLLSPVISDLAEKAGEYSFRILDLAPDQMAQVGMRGGFDLCVHYGEIGWPKTWVTEFIGFSPWVLCCRIDHPLSRKASLSQVLEYPFVVPIYWTQEGLARGNDQFPVSFSKRKLGFETSTALSVTPILEATNQLAFLPEVLVRSMVTGKRLKIIDAEGVAKVQKSVYVSARADSVPNTLFTDFCKLCEKLLAP